jgi:hypothetical protein
MIASTVCSSTDTIPPVVDPVVQVRNGYESQLILEPDTASNASLLKSILMQSLDRVKASAFEHATLSMLSSDSLQITYDNNRCRVIYVSQILTSFIHDGQYILCTQECAGTAAVTVFSFEFESLDEVSMYFFF